MRYSGHGDKFLASVNIQEYRVHEIYTKAVFRGNASNCTARLVSILL